MKLSDIYELVDDCVLLNDGEFDSLGLTISKPEIKLLSFVESDKYLDSIGEKITCLITTEEIGKKVKDKYGVIVSKTPRNSFFKLHNKLSTDDRYIRSKLKTRIGDRCKISDKAIIAENNVFIGNNVTIEENVIIRENVMIENNTIVRAGCILGGEGFEYKRTDGKIMNVIHCGGVILEEEVELQYNTCIDKALYTWDDTIIGKYSKLDNFVHIEHAVKISERCLIASRTTIGGRTIVGSDSWIGLGAIISNGLKLGRNSYVSLGAVVTKNLDESKKVSGNFAIDHNKYIEFIKKIR